MTVAEALNDSRGLTWNFTASRGSALAKVFPAMWNSDALTPALRLHMSLTDTSSSA